MEHTFKKIGIVGTGVMGRQLAALCAGAGVDVLLAGRFGKATDAIKELKTKGSRAAFSKSDLELIRPLSLDAESAKLSECDWVIEAVSETGDSKREVYGTLAEVAKKGAIISSTTSGFLWSELASFLPETLRPSFFITHFFNPPRHMKLVEMVAGRDADVRATARLSNFCESRLGRGVVTAKDTPAFIANRIGVFHFLDVMHMASREGWPIEAVDAVLGRPSARPKSAVFRTADMIGADVICRVAETVFKGCPDDAWIAKLGIPQFLVWMVTKGWMGDKAGRGFYRRDSKRGKTMALDLSKRDYRPVVNFCTDSTLETSSMACPKERLQRIAFAKDQAGEIAWPAISKTLVYSAEMFREFADSIATVDRTLRWGYGWEMGPFEMWDALGVKKVAQRLEATGENIPSVVDDILSSGRDGFYSRKDGRPLYFDVNAKKFVAIKDASKRTKVSRLRSAGELVFGNGKASLVDAGDGVFVCEFHSKKNVFDGDTAEVLQRALDHVEKDGVGLLIANDGECFCAGVDLKLILATVKSGEWKKLDVLVSGFQSLIQRVRFFPKPVISVPFGVTFGAGTELCLASAGRVAAMELYMGLPELAVGLVPAGGGCKNLLLSFEGRDGIAQGPHPKAKAAFELIAMSRLSGSAREAMELRFLSDGDAVVMDPELLLVEAKARLLSAVEGYAPPKPRDDILLSGRGGEVALMQTAHGLASKGLATEYDLVVAGKLARILAGGDAPTVHMTDEQHILDLEREAFLSLAGEKKTKERIEHMLKTGKPMRN